jgi:hypothetical protein
MGALHSVSKVSEASFLPATLDRVRRCPARHEYIELHFSTPEGSWTWCFPEPPQHRGRATSGPIALVLGAYGPQAHRCRNGHVGTAMPSGKALPMILNGAEVVVDRTLAASGL